MLYRIEQRIETLASNAVMKDGRMTASFSVGAVRFSHWDFDFGRGWPSHWWLAEASIDADNYRAAFKAFGQDMGRVVPRVSLIGQAYIDFLREPFLIVKEGASVGFFRYTVTRKGVGLMFVDDHRRALNHLLVESSIPEEFYYYWNDAVNATGYTPKLLLMFSAIESLAKNSRGKKDWPTIDKVLGRELAQSLFGTKENPSVGLRHRLIHGEYLSEADSETNYVEVIHKKVMAYFNDHVFRAPLLSLDVVNPQRHFWGNAEGNSWFIKSKGQAELTLKSVLADFAANDIDNLQRYDYVRDPTLENY